MQDREIGNPCNKGTLRSHWRFLSRSRGFKRVENGSEEKGKEITGSRQSPWFGVTSVSTKAAMRMKWWMYPVARLRTSIKKS